MLQSKSLEDKTGVLCFDEAAITEILDFNAQSHNFDGFIPVDPEAKWNCFIDYNFG